MKCCQRIKRPGCICSDLERRCAETQHDYGPPWNAAAELRAKADAEERKRSSKEGKRTTQLSDSPVESVMPLLHKEHNEGKAKAFTSNPDAIEGTISPSFGGPQQGEHTPYSMHAGHADKRDVCEGFSSIPDGFGAKVYLEPGAYFSCSRSFQRLSSLFPDLSPGHGFCREQLGRWLSHSRNCRHGCHSWP